MFLVDDSEAELMFDLRLTEVEAVAFARFERETIAKDTVRLVRSFLRDPEAYTRREVEHLVRHFESTGSPLSEAIRSRLGRCKKEEAS
jgi:hypothetical protein